MRGLRYFFRSMNVLNGLLAAAVAAVVYFAVIPFLDPAVQVAPPEVKATAALPAEKAAPAQSASPADYALISDQNLFHPERKIPPEKKAEVLVPKPDVFLYGTLITDEGSFAFIEDKRSPHTTPGRGKRQTTLKKGDRLNGYILQEVEANHIVFVKGEDTVMAMLEDKAKIRAVELSAPKAMSRVDAGGPSASQQPGAVLPQPAALPGTAPGAAVMPRPASSPALPSLSRSQQMITPSPQTDSPQGPGVGGSGVWPPTRSTAEQTRQKMQEAQRIRAEQIRGK